MCQCWEPICRHLRKICSSRNTSGLHLTFKLKVHNSTRKATWDRLVMNFHDFWMDGIKHGHTLWILLCRWWTWWYLLYTCGDEELSFHFPKSKNKALSSWARGFIVASKAIQTDSLKTARPSSTCIQPQQSCSKKTYKTPSVLLKDTSWTIVLTLTNDSLHCAKASFGP